MFDQLSVAIILEVWGLGSEKVSTATRHHHDSSQCTFTVAIVNFTAPKVAFCSLVKQPVVV